MKILILSDSHLHDEIILDIVAQDHFDQVIILGDLGNKLNPAFQDYTIVKGNNDFEDFPKYLVITYDNHKAFLCHGHYYNVEFGVDELVKVAKENGCDTVLFGHTHQPFDETIDGIHILNPGSIKFPRNGSIVIPTYIIYEDGVYSFYHAKKHEKLENLFAPKQKKPKDTTPKTSQEKTVKDQNQKSLIAKIIEFILNLFH